MTLKKKKINTRKKSSINRNILNMKLYNKHDKIIKIKNKIYMYIYLYLFIYNV